MSEHHILSLLWRVGPHRDFSRRFWEQTIQMWPSSWTTWLCCVRTRASTRKWSSTTNALCTSTRANWDQTTPTWQRPRTTWWDERKLFYIVLRSVHVFLSEFVFSHLKVLLWRINTVDFTFYVFLDELYCHSNLLSTPFLFLRLPVISNRANTDKLKLFTKRS